MSRRRALLGLGAIGLLGGCGFRPVYAPDGTRSVAANGPPALAAELAAVRVAPIGDRTGQLLRRYLQRRLEESRPGTPSRYELQAGISNSVEVLGYRPDGSITRVRYVATATWALLTEAVPPVMVERGTARTLDAYNIPDLQFFAADVSREAMERRILEELGERIVLGVAAALRRRDAAGPTPG